MKGVVRSAAGSFTIKVSRTILAFGTTVLLARVLGADGYGVFAWIMAWTGLLAIPASLGLDRLAIREVAARGATGDWGEARGVLQWSAWTVAGSSVLLAGIVFAAVWFIWNPSDPDLRAVFPLVFASLPFVVLTSLGHAGMRGLNHVVAAQIPENLVRPGLFVLLVLGATLLLPRDPVPADAALLYLVASVTGMVVAGWMLRRRIRPEMKAARSVYTPRAWIRASVPMMLVIGLAVLTSRTDTIMLGAIAGTEPAGVYFVTTRGAELILFLLTAFNMPLAPAIAALHASGDREGLQRLVTRTARLVFIGSLPVAIVMFVFGDSFLRLFGPGFPKGHTALAILCAAHLVNALTGSVGLILNMTGFQKDAAIGVGIGAALNVVLNAVLIPTMGIEGAAIATAVSLVVWNVVLAVMVYRRIGVHTTALGVIGKRR